MSSSTENGFERSMSPRMASKPFRRLPLHVLDSSASTYSLACETALAGHMDAYDDPSP